MVINTVSGVRRKGNTKPFGKEVLVDTRELKKVLAGVGIAGLLTGAGLGLGAAHAAEKAGGSG